MGSVAKVFAQIEADALTPEEISERSGLSISKVKEVLDFLEKFGLVKVEGSKITAPDDMMDLPED